ncbi:hypothetical protein GIB67_028475 [Kingdonia uniflora]|uniref:Uncharacterized protein n=1 Tax=Kingdonia uniflora TaxID=39325 RepID=A0A7J7P143_9MAGN|nr:hypothetical protein GIB67_028475 [Kingdonia uniflora]
MGSTGALISHLNFNNPHLNFTCKQQHRGFFPQINRVRVAQNQLIGCKRFSRVVCCALEDVNGKEQQKLGSGVGSALEERPRVIGGVIRAEELSNIETLTHEFWVSSPSNFLMSRSRMCWVLGYVGLSTVRLI